MQLHTQLVSLRFTRPRLNKCFPLHAHTKITIPRFVPPASLKSVATGRARLQKPNLYTTTNFT